MNKKLPFNKWSEERIAAGRKWCTSRSKVYSDPRVQWVTKVPLHIVRDFLYAAEGADSPEEFEQVWRSLHRGHFKEANNVYVHFGDFREVKS